MLFSGGVWMCLVVLLCGLCSRSMLSRPERFSRSDCRNSQDSLSLATPWPLPGQPRQNLDGAAASEDLVSTIVVPQLREASKTKTYHLDIFDRVATGAPERSIEFLYRCARQCPARNDREIMRTSLTTVSAVAHVCPERNAATKMPWYAWIRRKCKLGGQVSFRTRSKECFEVLWC